MITARLQENLLQNEQDKDRRRRIDIIFGNHLNEAIRSLIDYDENIALKFLMYGKY